MASHAACDELSPTAAKPSTALMGCSTKGNQKRAEVTQRVRVHTVKCNAYNALSSPLMAKNPPKNQT
eukprot:scaffold7611_cov79-Skeletonema_dohrnii-CCMP3373.AAC.1